MGALRGGGGGPPDRHVSILRPQPARNHYCARAIALFVLVEKVAPFERATGRVAGLVLILAGVYLLFSGRTV